MKYIFGIQMKRAEFTKKLHEDVKGVYPVFSNRSDNVCTLYLDINEEKHEADYQNQLFFAFNDFLTENGLNKKDIISKFNFKKELDLYFLDDLGGAESDYYKYIVTFDSQEIFDVLVSENIIKSNKSIVYRIEKENGAGLYDGVGTAILKDYDNQESPYKDPELRTVFTSESMRLTNSKYFENWIFGFQNLNAAKKWLGDEAIIEKLKKNGLKIVRFEVPDSDVLHGKQQSTFKKEKAIKIEEIDLDCLLEKNRIANKKKLTI